MKSYCIQNNGKCKTCSLVNYGMDCQNNPIQERRQQAGYTAFEKYAINKGVHNGMMTLRELRKVYQEFKGNKWDAIIEIFKLRGIILNQKEYIEVLKED